MKRRDAFPSDVKPAQRQWIKDFIKEGYAVGLAKAIGRSLRIAGSTPALPTLP
jgi:hypothetical protein